MPVVPDEIGTHKAGKMSGGSPSPLAHCLILMRKEVQGPEMSSNKRSGNGAPVLRKDKSSASDTEKSVAHLKSASADSASGCWCPEARTN